MRPAAEIPRHLRVGRKLLRNLSPLAARRRHVEDRVNDRPKGDLAWPAFDGNDAATGTGRPIVWLGIAGGHGGKWRMTRLALDSQPSMPRLTKATGPADFSGLTPARPWMGSWRIRHFPAKSRRLDSTPMNLARFAMIGRGARPSEELPCTALGRRQTGQKSQKTADTKSQPSCGSPMRVRPAKSFPVGDSRFLTDDKFELSGTVPDPRRTAEFPATRTAPWRRCRHGERAWVGEWFGRVRAAGSRCPSASHRHPR